MYTHTHTHHFDSHFSWGEPGLASCPYFVFHLFLNCAFFQDRPKLFISSLPQYHQVFLTAMFYQPSYNASLSLCSTCPNRCYLLFLITKLTAFSSSSSHQFTFLPFSVLHTHLSISFQTLSTSIGQLSLPCVRQLTQLVYALPLNFSENPFSIFMWLLVELFSMQPGVSQFPLHFSVTDWRGCNCPCRMKVCGPDNDRNSICSLGGFLSVLFDTGRWIYTCGTKGCMMYHAHCF